MNMSHRVEKVASTLRYAIQQVLARGLHDPRVSGLVTVLSVEVTQDLRNATVRVSVLPAEKQQMVYYGLRDAARHIRHEVSEMVDMRSVPQLAFKVDSTLKKEAQTLAAIAKIAEERAASGLPAATEAPAGDREGADAEGAEEGRGDGGADRGRE